MFPLRFGKCEIAQTGLEKYKFAQNIYLSLPKSAIKLAQVGHNKIVQSQKNLAQTHAKMMLKYYISLPNSSQETALTLLAHKRNHFSEELKRSSKKRS